MSEPIIITELDTLIKQATAERSHYYVKSVAEKAQLAIGILMSNNQCLAKENADLRESLKVAIDAFTEVQRCDDMLGDSQRRDIPIIRDLFKQQLDALEKLKGVKCD